MDPIIYFVADLYPWWGLPMAFILFEMANRARRRSDRKRFLLFGFLGGIFGGFAVAYFFFNGYSKMRPAMQDLERWFTQR